MNLGLEVLVIVDDAQVRVAGPGGDDSLVEFARHAQSLLVGGLAAFLVVGGGVELLCSIGSRDKMEHGIVALIAKLGRSRADILRQPVPEGGLHVGGDVHRATVADDDGGHSARLGHAGKVVFQLELRLQCGLLLFVEEVAVGRCVVYACLREHCGHLGNGEDFESEAGEVLDGAHQSSGLSGAGSAGEYYFLDLTHNRRMNFSENQS